MLFFIAFLFEILIIELEEENKIEEMFNVSVVAAAT